MPACSRPSAADGAISRLRGCQRAAIWHPRTSDPHRVPGQAYRQRHTHEDCAQQATARPADGDKRRPVLRGGAGVIHGRRPHGRGSMHRLPAGCKRLRTPDLGRCRPAAAQRAAGRVTSSAAATVTTVTAATDGHAPMRLASGCEPPIAARYSALSPAAAPGPDVRYQSRAHQAPAAANSAPPSSRRPLQRATVNPPMSPTAATAEEETMGMPVTALTLPTGVSQADANRALRRCGRCRAR